MDIVQRIKKLIEEKHGARGVSSFAKAIGVEQVTLSRHLSGARSVSLDVIESILKTYPEVSAEWLLRGVESNQLVTNKNLRPRVPCKAAAGSLSDAVEGITEIECEQIEVIPAFPKYDFTIRITGDSMIPYYISGDEVACLRIKHVSFLQWGKVHVLDTSQGIIIKRIYENGDCIRCVSFNPEYTEFNIPKEEIYSYNLVVGILRL